MYKDLGENCYICDGWWLCAATMVGYYRLVFYKLGLIVLFIIFIPWKPKLTATLGARLVRLENCEALSKRPWLWLLV